MTSAPRAVVAGGGIGGLAAALGLRRGGWQVQVLERRTAAQAGAQAGSGISIWPNGLAALAALGVDEQALAGTALSRNGVRTASGRWMSRTDIGAPMRARFGRPLVITSRARLAAALTGALGPGLVSHGADVTAVDPETGTARCGDQEYPASLVIIADGGRSALREAVTGPGPALRYAGYTSWRFIAPRPPGPVDAAETWGPGGLRFAVLPLDAAQVYCYATAAAPPGGHAADERDELRRLFAAWHPPVPGLLAALPPGAVIRTDIGYLADPPAAWHRGRAALLGDAAHAMTPDLGQGGCQALEDAATLAALLPARRAGDVPGVLAEYTALRAGRAASVARRSVRAGRLYGAPMWLRTLAARATAVVPAPLLVRGLAPVVDWAPPPAPPAGKA